MMKTIYIKIYASIAILLIAGTITWFVTGIVSDSNKGALDAKKNFEYFAKSAIQLSTKKIITGSSYNSGLISLAQEMDIIAFRISESNDKVLVSWSKYPMTADKDITFEKKKSGIFVKSFKAKINLSIKPETEEVFLVEGALNTLKPDTIFVRSRSAFFMILTIGIITLLIILFQSLGNTDNRVYTDFSQSDKTINNIEYASYEQQYKPLNNVESIPHTMQEITSEENYESAKKKEFSKENLIEKDIHLKNIEEQEYTLEDLDDLTIIKNYPYEATKNDTTVIIESVPKQKTEELFVNKNDIKISNNTGVSLQENLYGILEAELKRSASSEQDLALIIIKLKDLSLESIVAKKIAKILVDFIKFKEMIFEYEETGFVAIVYDTDIDTAMEIAEHIYKRIQKILDEYIISEPIAIGITTRATRLISANRIIEEAGAALARAIKNPNDPIVAFKVNPDKYRKYIAEN